MLMFLVYQLSNKNSSSEICNKVYQQRRLESHKKYGMKTNVFNNKKLSFIEMFWLRKKIICQKKFNTHSMIIKPFLNFDIFSRDDDTFITLNIIMKETWNLTKWGKWKIALRQAGLEPPTSWLEYQSANHCATKFAQIKQHGCWPQFRPV